MACTETAGRPPLSAELHAATRSEHATLNRSIITRLPLCLSNATSTPDLYAQGITVFGQIYYGIEEAWDLLLSDRTLSQRHKEIVAELDIPRLRRAKRLDISLQQLRFKSRDPFGESLPNLAAASTHFRDEIKNLILQNPHLLVAYTWTMYLALFNGGRWIAKQLLSAGPAFWRDDERAATVSGALSFWFFGETEDYDGEDIKIAFKEGFNVVAEDLTDQERDEIIAESKRLFQTCADMVAYLDQHVQQSVATEKAQALAAVVADTVPQTDASGVFAYLASYAPVSVVSFWRSMFTRVPLAQTPFPVSLRHDIEQKN